MIFLITFAVGFLLGIGMFFINSYLCLNNISYKSCNYKDKFFEVYSGGVNTDNIVECVNSLQISYSELSN
jgi:hypothetical protein